MDVNYKRQGLTIIIISGPSRKYLFLNLPYAGNPG